MKQVYLLTGRPGTGKTSLIKQAVADREYKTGRFYTGEIRQGGIRQGFRLVTVDGQDTILAHTGIKSPCRVGKYGVDIELSGQHKEPTPGTPDYGNQSKSQSGTGRTKIPAKIHKSPKV